MQDPNLDAFLTVHATKNFMYRLNQINRCDDFGDSSIAEIKVNYEAMILANGIRGSMDLWWKLKLIFMKYT